MTGDNRSHRDTTESFETLLKDAGDGSEVAVWKLLEVYGPYISRAIGRRFPESIRSKLDPADVAQSVWKSFLRHPSRLARMSSSDQLVAYLVGMAKLKTLEAQKRFTTSKNRDVRRETSLSDVEQRLGDDARVASDNPCASRDMSPSSIVSMREKWGNAVQASGSRGAAMLQLRLKGHSHDQIAVQLRVSKATVRRTMKDILASLQA